jgi:hypothetical protein
VAIASTARRDGRARNEHLLDKPWDCIIRFPTAADAYNSRFMVTLPAVLLLAAAAQPVPSAVPAAVDGAAALRHAAALAALGPHPWGSPRGRAAAAYVESQLRAAGIPDVRLAEFETAGIRGTNVIGTLRAPGEAFIVVSAHHDTAPEAPGAYDDGGGVGVLLETARVLAGRASRPLTVVFVSFDGEEAWWTRKVTTAGSRSYVKSLGADARNLVAAFVVEMCGWRAGTPVLHSIAYPDPLRPGQPVVAPGWVVSAALSGSRHAGQPFGVGDPWVSWLYQPAVRSVHVGLYGDDVSFLQAGLPAVFASDSSFSAFYPSYHRPTDTVDKLDPDALARMGRAVVGALDGLAAARPGPRSDPAWFAAFGHVLGGVVLLAAGAAAIVARLARAAGSPPGVLALRLVQAGLIGFLLWRQPVPAAWLFVWPLVLTSISPAAWAKLLGFLPAVGLVALAGAAWSRGIAGGSWFPRWQVAMAAVALLLFLVPLRRGSAAKPAGRRKPSRGRA